jgi:hypothetical protein
VTFVKARANIRPFSTKGATLVGDVLMGVDKSLCDSAIMGVNMGVFDNGEPPNSARV